MDKKPDFDESLECIRDRLPNWARELVELYTSSTKDKIMTEKVHQPEDEKEDCRR